MNKGEKRARVYGPGDTEVPVIHKARRLNIQPVLSKSDE